MLKLRNKLLAILVALFCCFTVMGFVAYRTNNRVAKAAVSDGFSISSATARVTSEERPNALVFWIRVESAHLNTYFENVGGVPMLTREGTTDYLTLKEGYESKFVLIPSHYLSGTEGEHEALTLQTKSRAVVDTTNSWQPIMSGSNVVGASTRVVVYNIPQKAWATNFTSSALFIDDNDNYTYSNNSASDYSLAGVAKATVEAGGISSELETALKQYYYENFTITYKDVDGTVLYTDTAKSFGDAVHASPSKSGFTFVGWKNDVTGAIDTTVKAISYTAKWALSKGTSTTAETAKPIIYDSATTTGFETKGAYFLSGSTGDKGYYYTANGNISEPAEATFLSSTGASVGTDGFSFKYRLLSAKEAAIPGATGNAMYLVKIGVEEGGALVWKTVSFSPATDGSEQVFSVVTGTSLLEGGTFGAYARRFRGFKVVLGDLDGELCISNVSCLLTSFSTALKIDLGYTVTAGAATSALAGSTLDIENLPFDDTYGVVRYGAETVNYIAAVGEYASVDSYDFIDADSMETKNVTTYGAFAGRYGAGSLVVHLSDENGADHELTIPVEIIAKGIYNEADLRAISAVSDLLADDDPAVNDYSVKAKKYYGGEYVFFNDIAITGLGKVYPFRGVPNMVSNIQKGDVGNVLATFEVNDSTFTAKIVELGEYGAEKNGQHAFQYSTSSGKWVYDHNTTEYTTAELSSLFGITFTLTEGESLADGTSIVVSVQEDWTPVTPEIYQYVGTGKNGSGTVTITINKTTFASKVANTEGEYVFTYNGSAWQLDETNVTLSQYGITYTGTPVSGETFTVCAETTFQPITDGRGYYYYKSTGGSENKWWSILTTAVFTGTIDGNGHTIENLTLAQSRKGLGSSNYASAEGGFVGGIFVGEFKNIGFKDLTIGIETTLIAPMFFAQKNGTPSLVENVYVGLKRLSGAYTMTSILADAERKTINEYADRSKSYTDYTANHVIVDLSKAFLPIDEQANHFVTIGAIENTEGFAQITDYYVITNFANVMLFGVDIDKAVQRDDRYVDVNNNLWYLGSNGRLVSDVENSVTIDSANKYAVFASYDAMKSNAEFKSTLTSWNTQYWNTLNNVPEFGLHEHTYVYVDNGDGTHNVSCYCGEVDFDEAHTLGYVKRNNSFVYGCLNCEYTVSSYDIVSADKQYIDLQVAYWQTLDENDEITAEGYAPNSAVMDLDLDLGYSKLESALGATIAYSVDGVAVQKIEDLYNILPANTYGGSVLVDITVTLAGDVISEQQVEVVLVTKFVNSVSDFNYISVLSESLGGYGYFALASDLQYSANFAYPIGTEEIPFNGTIDGLGHTISGFSSNSNRQLIRFMGATGTLKNIRFTDFRYGYNGGLVSHAVEGATIENVYVQVTDYGFGGTYGQTRTENWASYSYGVAYLIGEDTTNNTVINVNNMVVDYSEIADELALHTTAKVGDTNNESFSQYDVFFAKVLNSSTFTNVVISGVNGTTTTAWTNANEARYGYKHHIVRSGDTSSRGNGGDTNAGLSDGSSFGIYVSYTDGTTNGATFPTTDWDNEFWRAAGLNVMSFGHTHTFTNIASDNNLTHSVYCSCGLVSQTLSHTLDQEITSDGAIRFYCTDGCGYEVVINANVPEVVYIDSLSTVSGTTLTFGTGVKKFTDLMDPELAASFTAIGASITDYKVGGVSWKTGPARKKIGDIGSANFDDTLDVEVVFSYNGGTYSYIQKVIIVTKTISTAADFVAIKDYVNAIANGTQGTGANTYKNYTKKGYFRLANDIELSMFDYKNTSAGGSLSGNGWTSYTLASVGTNNILGYGYNEASTAWDNRITASFAGVIDGNGYTVDNLAVSTHGSPTGGNYWITTPNNCTIKNIAFTDVVFGPSCYFTGIGEVNYEDVYVDIDAAGVTLRNNGSGNFEIWRSVGSWSVQNGLTPNSGNAANITHYKNVVVDYTDSTEYFKALGFAATADENSRAFITAANNGWYEGTTYYADAEKTIPLTFDSGSNYWSGFQTGYANCGGTMMGFAVTGSTIENLLVLGAPDLRVSNGLTGSGKTKSTIIRTGSGVSLSTFRAEGLEGATYNASLDAVLSGMEDSDFWKIVNGYPYPRSFKIVDTETFDSFEVDLDVYVNGSGDLAKKNSGSKIVYIPSEIYNTRTVVDLRNAIDEGDATFSFADYIVNNNRVSIPYSEIPATLCGEKTFYLVTDDNCYYAIDITFITKTIYTKEELLSTAITGEGGVSDLIADDTTVKNFGGYFKLGADIDIDPRTYAFTYTKAIFSSATAVASNTSSHSSEFIGTLDGNMHTISNVYVQGDKGGSTQIGSFIQVLGVGATIKNISFTNLRIGYCSTLIEQFAATNATEAAEIRLENVYVSVLAFGSNSTSGDDIGTNGVEHEFANTWGQSSVFGMNTAGTRSELTMRNVVVDFSPASTFMNLHRDQNVNSNFNNVVFGKIGSSSNPIGTSTFENVAVIGLSKGYVNANYVGVCTNSKVTVSVDAATFTSAFASSNGSLNRYSFTYTTANGWRYNNAGSTLDMASIGITVTGTPANNNGIYVNKGGYYENRIIEIRGLKTDGHLKQFTGASTSKYYDAGIYVEYTDGTTNGVARPTTGWDDCWNVTDAVVSLKPAATSNDVLTAVGGGYVVEKTLHVDSFDFNGETFASKVGNAEGTFNLYYTWIKGDGFNWRFNANTAAAKITLSEYGFTNVKTERWARYTRFGQIVVTKLGAGYTLNTRQLLDLDVSTTGTTNNNVAIDLAEVKGLVGDTVTDVTLNGTSIATNLSVTDNKIVLNTSNIPVWTDGEQTLVITTVKNSTTNKIAVPVLIVTKMIETFDEFKALNTYSAAITKAHAIADTDGAITTNAAKIYRIPSGNRFRPGEEGIFDTTQAQRDLATGTTTYTTFESNATVYDGYFMLANDIDADGYVWTTSDVIAYKSGMYATAFRGTFDGNGHKIIGMTFSGSNDNLYATFGVVTGTIKNVAFTDVTASGKAGVVAAYCGADWYSTKLIVHPRKDTTDYKANGHIENVYVSYKSITATATNNAAIATFSNYLDSGKSYLYVYNCLVDVTGATFNNEYGFVATGFSAGFDNYYNHVYAVGMKDKMGLLGFTYGIVMCKNGSAVNYKNATSSWADNGGNAYTNQRGYTGFYDSWADFYAALNSPVASYITPSGNADTNYGTYKRSLGYGIESFDTDFWSINRFSLKCNADAVSAPSLPSYTVNFYDEAGENILYSYTVEDGTNLNYPVGPSKESALLEAYSFGGWTNDGGETTHTSGTLTVHADESYYATFVTDNVATKIASEGAPEVKVSGASFVESYNLYKALGHASSMITSYYITGNNTAAELAFVTRYGAGYNAPSFSFYYRWADETGGTATATVKAISSTGVLTTIGTLTNKTGAYAHFTASSAISDFAGFKVVFSGFTGEFLLNDIATGHVHGTVTVTPGSDEDGDAAVTSGNVIESTSADNSKVYYYCTCGMFLADAKAGISITESGSVVTAKATGTNNVIYQVDKYPSARNISLNMSVDGSGNASFASRKVDLDLGIVGAYTVDSIYYNGVSIGEGGSTISTGKLYRYNSETGKYVIPSETVYLTVSVIMTANNRSYEITLPVNVVAKEIATYSDLNNFAAWSKAYSAATTVGEVTSYGGYFLVTSDIDYSEYKVEHTYTQNSEQRTATIEGFYYYVDSANQIVVNNSFMTDEQLMLNPNYVDGVNAAINGANDAIPFNGTLDGGGHAIQNMKLADNKNSYVGFIYNLGNAGELKNIAFTGLRFRASTLVATGNGSIEDVYVEFASAGTYFAASGLATTSDCGSIAPHLGTFGFDPNYNNNKLTRVVVNMMNDNVAENTTAWNASTIGTEKTTRKNNGTWTATEEALAKMVAAGSEITSFDGLVGYSKSDKSYNSPTYHNVESTGNKYMIGRFTAKGEASLNGVYAIVGRWNNDPSYRTVQTYDVENDYNLKGLSSPIKGVWGQYDGYESFLGAQGSSFNTSNWDKWSYEDGVFKFNNIVIYSGEEVAASVSTTGKLFNSTTGTSDYVIVSGESQDSVSAAGFIAKHLTRAAAKNGFDTNGAVAGGVSSIASANYTKNPTNARDNLFVTETITNPMEVKMTTGISEASANANYLVIGNEEVAGLYGITLPAEGKVKIATKNGATFILAGKDVDYEAAAILFLQKAIGYNALDWELVDYNGYSVDTTLTSMLGSSGNLDLSVAVSYRQQVNASLGNYRRANLGYNATTIYYYGPLVQNASGYWVNQSWHNTFNWLPYETFVSGSGDNGVSASNTHWKWYSNYVSGSTPSAPDGSTTGEDQLCYTAHGDAEERALMIKVAGDRIAARLLSDSSIHNISFTHQDNAHFCSCSDCTNKTPSFLILQFVNDLCAYIENNYSIPQEWSINFFAYKETMEAPSAYDLNTISINEHVGVVLAPIQAAFAQSIYASANNEFRNNMEIWASKVGKVGCWYYCVDFQNYFNPLDCFATMLTWIEHAANTLHTSWLFWQGASRSAGASSFAYFKEYINSRAAIEILDKVGARADYVTHDAYMVAIHNYLAELESDFFGVNVSVDGSLVHTATSRSGYYGYYGPTSVGTAMFNAYTANNKFYAATLALAKADVDNGYGNYANSLAAGTGASFGDTNTWTSTGEGTVRDKIDNVVWTQNNKKYIRRFSFVVMSTKYNANGTVPTGGTVNYNNSYTSSTGNNTTHYAYIAIAIPENYEEDNCVQAILNKFPPAFTSLASAYSSFYNGSAWTDEEQQFQYERYYKNIVRETLFGRFLCSNDYNVAVSYWFKHLGGYSYYSDYGLTLTESSGIVKSIVADSKLATHRKAFMADCELLYICQYAEDFRTTLYAAAVGDNQYGLYKSWLISGSISSFTVPQWEGSGFSYVPAKGTTVEGVSNFVGYTG